MLSIFFNQKNNKEINSPASDDAYTNAISQAVSDILQQDEVGPQVAQVYQMPPLPTETYSAEVIADDSDDSIDASRALPFPMPEIPIETFSAPEDSIDVAPNASDNDSEPEVFEMPEAPDLPVDFDFDDSVRN